MEEAHTPSYTPLQISQENLRAILNSVVDGIITIDMDGIIEAANPSAETMFGYAGGELIGQNISNLMPISDVEEHDQYRQNGLKTEESKSHGIGRELTAKRKDGSKFPIEISMSEVDHLSIYTVIIRDMTERKREQKKLLQSERLAGLGEASAGLVHESRNSLARIQANLRMMKRRMPNDAQLSQLMSNALEASDDLTRQFEEVREFSSSVKPKVTITDLRCLMNKAWGQLTVEATSSDISFVVTSGTENIFAEVDQSMMTNAFRNILQNALDSMQNSGTIIVSFRVPKRSPQNSIWITFEDDGSGISEKEATRAFDRLYTTNTRGTGLGLAIAKRYIEAHAGSVRIAPAEMGTRVTVTLPTNSNNQE